MSALVGSFSKISNEELDALSSDDEDDDSDDEYVAPPPLSSLTSRTAAAAAKRKTQLEDFAGFEDGVDMDDPISKQMQAVLSLRLCLNMDSDKEFMKEQEAKKAERDKLASMTPEEKLAYQEQKAGNALSKVASKYDLDAIKKRWAAQSASLEKPEVSPFPTSKECDATASESGSLSDEAETRSVKDVYEGNDKRKKKEAKSKDKKKKDDAGEKKKKESKSKDKKSSDNKNRSKDKKKKDSKK